MAQLVKSLLAMNLKKREGGVQINLSTKQKYNFICKKQTWLSGGGINGKTGIEM